MIPHADVVEGVPVVLGNAGLTFGLVVIDFLVGQSDLSNEAAEVGIRVLHGLDEIDDLLVVESESGEVLVGLDGGEVLSELVVLLADPEHERVFSAGALDAKNHVGASFPGFDEDGDEGCGILEVGDDADHGIAASLEKSMDRRTDVAEVAGVDDDLWWGKTKGE